MAQAIKGFQGLAGLKKASTWGTAVVCAAGSGFEHSNGNSGITTSFGVIDNNQMSGVSYTRASDLGVWTSSGSYGADFVYETAALPLALSLGTAGAPTQVGGDLAYTHKLRLKDDPYGIFGTLVFPASTVEVIEYPTVKFGGFEFAVSSTGPATLTHNVIATRQNVNTVSGTNTNVTAATITIPTNRARALGPALVFWMNAQAGAALQSSDAVPVTSINVSFSRGLAGKHSTLGQTVVDEPEPTGFVTVTGSYTMPRFDSAAIAQHVLAFAKSQHKASITIPGTLANGATNYSVAIYLNGIQIDGEPKISGPGADEVTFTFTAHGVAAVPTGFPTGLLHPIGIDLINTMATDVLA